MEKKLTALLALLLCVSLCACGGGAKNASYESAPQSAADMNMEAAEYGGAYWNGASTAEKASSTASGDLPSLDPSVKMVYRASMELETTEFDQAAGDIDTLVEQLGGYLEEQSVRNYSSGYRYATYTVRVPAEKFRPFLNQIGEVCHVVYQTQSAENITERYYDTDSRLRTAQTKLDRLQELLSKADNMADIITLEEAISDTEYEIESLSGTLRHYDALVGYATIGLELREVTRLTEVTEPPATFGQKLLTSFREGLKSFAEGLEDLALWLAYHWLGLLVFVAIAALVVRLFKRRGKGIKLGRRKKDKTPPDGSGEG